MSTYRPSNVPSKPEEIPAFLRVELARLVRALNDAQPDVRLLVRHAEPQKYEPGTLVYADGTDWDPGSGEGLYRRDKTNASWVFVG